MTTPVLETRGLVHALGEGVKTVVLDDVSLRVARGDFVALTGHSGSGKSTLLYLLGALDQPVRGDVILDGVNIARLDETGRARIRNQKLGFVFQFHFLLPEFTVLENVMIPILRRGVPKAAARLASLETLEALNLAEYHHRRPAQLSGGQQQRVSIARATANRPTILLADEPTGNLDSKNGDAVMDLFCRINREQKVTIVMVTHDSDFAERATRRIVLKDGRIVSDT
jgi:lipoprotein-releasing system ATP-binding protein